ncbi:MAG: Fibrillarin-like rRNA/tRNA 2'-O-methyltransferase [Candidatus Syntrophoarchaeum sp. GoM_oil]|nr:MAG: Fibrillarin-like rRNA/tRNA 2'-O-methyltransferase [Candidatus Syntrophoarchaeum sp. GoM_oil]
MDPVPNITLIDDRLVTLNFVPGRSVYGEPLLGDYRSWSPRRSKLASAILKGLRLPISKDSSVLYLGASTGTTASHLSDILSGGRLYVVEFAKKPMIELVRLCEERCNMIPIFEDANYPERYREVVGEVDLIYQDIAQRNQAEILIRNADLFRKKSGWVIIAIKARSIDVARSAEDIFNSEIEKLEERFEISGTFNLSPGHKDHLMVFGRETADI